MNDHVLQQILYLGKLVGEDADPKFRRLILRLTRRFDQHLAERVLKRLTYKAGDDAFDPPAYPPIREDKLIILGFQDVPYTDWGHAARVRAGEVERLFPFRVFFPATF